MSMSLCVGMYMYLWKPESSDLGELELEVVVSHPKADDRNRTKVGLLISEA